MYAAMERVANRVHPGATVMPQMSTGASDQAQLRAKGIQSYGIGPAATEEDDVNYPRTRCRAPGREVAVSVRPVRVGSGERGGGTAEVGEGSPPLRHQCRRHCAVGDTNDAGQVRLANLTGWPGLVVPAGFTGDPVLPVTLSFVGPTFSAVRRLAPTTPPLPGERFEY